jgi:hypothetical protein
VRTDEQSVEHNLTLGHKGVYIKNYIQKVLINVEQHFFA